MAVIGTGNTPKALQGVRPGGNMARLTAADRKALPSKDFALSGGRYPIEDAGHARNALARVSQHGSPGQKAEVRGAVRRKFPGIKQEAQHNHGGCAFHSGCAMAHP